MGLLRNKFMMNPVLLHLYGPLSIHAYGLCIAIGGFLSFFLLTRDQKAQALVSEKTMITILQIILVAGFLGGRILEMLAQPNSSHDLFFVFRFWEPGLSVLGAILAAIGALVVYLYCKKIPPLLLLDRISLYIPLAQGFGRLGCFFAGCCYGLPTNHWIAITYSHPNHLAPLDCALHPSQLYAAAILFFIFLSLYFVLQYQFKKSGILLCSYLLAIGVERFLIDFIRWDRVFITEPFFLSLFSLHQWIALGICSFAILSIFFISKRRQ